ncbi:MAG TPA: bifunctional phosphoribosyl-AMP cyclohydrolase/phosphoribosyl-ATP diphosphatase HisIE [Thermoanaerobaculia bacterium]|jgi:phosphoribosyl-ATP pyrophosphohydrolase/phosphoribosyl-AMP cyclohydrolase|nr:bifunctional phosphoribosyl-AMP cyclohydrolase/phosphoribosyl-ATP diphosphatase HisIE [Thermoanaerobaculia bacterium]
MKDLKFTDGLIPAIVRDALSGAILTLAYMNEESLKKTIETGETWFWSRSRDELWHKGATSGNTQRVVHIASDCDGDALVVSVLPAGPACHTGAASCFEDIPAPALDLPALMRVLRDRYESRPDSSYSASLFNAGRAGIVRKVGEEATEVIIAALSEPRDRVVSEVADLMFHVSVLLTDIGIDWSEIGQELRRRAK